MIMELVPYSETRRDLIEDRLKAEANKREINYRSSNGIEVIAYWLMKENVCTIYVRDEQTDSAGEFQVPNDQVDDWFNHPYAHRNAPRFESPID